jgi:hypothetical protein
MSSTTTTPLMAEAAARVACAARMDVEFAKSAAALKELFKSSAFTKKNTGSVRQRARPPDSSIESQEPLNPALVLIIEHLQQELQESKIALDHVAPRNFLSRWLLVVFKAFIFFNNKSLDTKRTNKN